MRVAIVGGGINGLCCAWACTQMGCSVHIYERDVVAGATSSASSKLLHGGLRYLEQYNFRLVREALRERDAWLQRVPQFTQALRLIIPVYRHGMRNRFIIGAGLFLYDHLVGKSILPPAQWITKKLLLEQDIRLKSDGLLGGYEFSDGQMDDQKLALWVAEQVQQAGGKIYEHTPVTSICNDGSVDCAGKKINYDYVINAAGPWAIDLLISSGVSTKYSLDLVRGSHIIVDKAPSGAYLLEVPGEKRIFFVLPWQGKALIGTTEVRQNLHEIIACSPEEQSYLLQAYNHYFTSKVSEKNVTGQFAGLRPLLRSAADPSQATREYALEQNDRLISVFGGKWTTAYALGRKVASLACGGDRHDFTL